MKVLIYFDKNLLAPTGGPAGYLYNLNQELEKKGITNIEFLDNKTAKSKKVIRKILKGSPKFIKKIYSKYRANYGTKIIRDIFFDNNFVEFNFNKYDIVHFHSTISLYKCKEALKNYKGIVLLTSHTPKAPYLEIIDNINEKNRKKYKREIQRLDLVDEYAFDRANYIIFPCKEAEECYYNTWNKYEEIHNRNINKYLYIPTGINEVAIYNDNESIRKMYNIPDDAFVISYVGRHNEVKGYASLKEIGKKILSENDNVYFLIGGREEPIKGLKNDHWIEVGWTDKPHDLINASDMFILPNKETYFDLVLLEVLSVGKTVLITNTGGNKYLKQFNDSGIFYYEYNDIEMAIKQINKLIGEKELLYKYDEKNKKILEENFTTEVYTKKYIELLNNIKNRRDDGKI